MFTQFKIFKRIWVICKSIGLKFKEINNNGMFILEIADKTLLQHVDLYCGTISRSFNFKY